MMGMNWRNSPSKTRAERPLLVEDADVSACSAVKVVRLADKRRVAMREASWPSSPPRNDMSVTLVPVV